MTEPGIKLPIGADELLKDLPLPEPDFEAQARAIEATLGVRPVPSLSDDDLFRAPELAAEPGEPPLPSQVRAAAPKSNFAEMARKSVQKQEESAAALAKELLAATAQSRRPNAEMVERVRAAGKAAATSTPLPASQPRAERNSGVVTRGEPAPIPQVGAVAPAAKPANDNRGTIVGVVGVLVAIAACAALYVKTRETPSPTAAAVAAEQAAAAATPHAVAPPAPVAAPPKADEDVVSPEALARADARPAAEAPHGASVSKALGAGAPKTAAAASAHGATPEAVKLEEDTPPPQAVAKTAEAAPEPPLTPAAAEVQHTGSVPLTPSSGAVSTALSSVRGGAQACLAGQTEPVSAVVTFASDGHVLRVSASGPAASCIQAALSKARIAPFAKESFSAPTTVRPP